MLFAMRSAAVLVLICLVLHGTSSTALSRFRRHNNAANVEGKDNGKNTQLVIHSCDKNDDCAKNVAGGCETVVRHRRSIWTEFIEHMAVAVKEFYRKPLLTEDINDIGAFSKHFKENIRVTRPEFTNKMLSKDKEVENGNNKRRVEEDSEPDVTKKVKNNDRTSNEKMYKSPSESTNELSTTEAPEYFEGDNKMLSYDWNGGESQLEDELNDGEEEGSESELHEEVKPKDKMINEQIQHAQPEVAMELFDSEELDEIQSGEVEEDMETKLKKGHKINKIQLKKLWNEVNSLRKLNKKEKIRQGMLISEIVEYYEDMSVEDLMYYYYFGLNDKKVQKLIAKTIDQHPDIKEKTEKEIQEITAAREKIYELDKALTKKLDYYAIREMDFSRMNDIIDDVRCMNARWFEEVTHSKVDRNIKFPSETELL